MPLSPAPRPAPRSIRLAPRLALRLLAFFAVFLMAGGAPVAQDGDARSGPVEDAAVGEAAVGGGAREDGAAVRGDVVAQIDPAGPVTPVAPVDPVVPVDPVAPVDPVVPVDPEGGADASPQAPMVADAGEIVDVRPLGRVSPQRVQIEAGPLFAGIGSPIIENAVDAYQVRYVTTDLDGSRAEVAAWLLVPVLDEAREVPLYAFGPGTTGLAPACAPSREEEYSGHPLGYYRAYGQALAGRGVATIVPDYLGFDGDPARLQEYFNARAEAHVMLDALRAGIGFLARPESGVGFSGHAFAGGYSQGGHAAFAAADLLASYAPEVPLAGLLGFGSTNDVEALLLEGPYYAPYIVASYAQSAGLDPAEVLARRWATTLRTDVTTRCVDEAQRYYPYDVDRIFRPELALALRLGTVGDVSPLFARLLDANLTGLGGHGLPALVVQGSDDIIVRDPTQLRFVRRLCEAGSDVQYLAYPGVRHRSTRAAGFDASLAWMRGIAAGEAAPTSCGLLP